MEKLKIQVKSVKKSADSVSVCPTKDIKLSEDLTLKKDKLFTSVSTWVWNKMPSPKSINVYLVNGRLYADPVF